MLRLRWSPPGPLVPLFSIALLLLLVYYEKRRDDMKVQERRKRAGRPKTRPNDEMILSLYETFTADEIAQAFEVSPNTVRSWVMRARQAKERTVMLHE